MAGDWIKMRRGLRHDPKVIAIARQLTESREFADWWGGLRAETSPSRRHEIVTFANVTRVTVCALLDVWASLNNAIREDGKMPFMTLQDLDDISEIPGFGQAMASVGWVVCLESEGLEFPNFTEHNAPAKERSAQPKSAAQRAKEYRERQRQKQEQNEASQSSRDVTTEKRREEKRRYTKKLSPDGESKESATEGGAPPAADGSDEGLFTPGELPPEKSPRKVVQFAEVVAAWNELCPSLPSVAEITDRRKQAIRARWTERLKAGAESPLDWFRSLFERIERSDFLCGRTPSKAHPYWRAGFDFCLHPTNTAKIIEGHYDNRAKKTQVKFQANGMLSTGIDYSQK